MDTQQDENTDDQDTVPERHRIGEKYPCEEMSFLKYEYIPERFDDPIENCESNANPNPV